ncbi:hypothetical protein Ocin01_10003, partial [Orchesella cincta]
ILMTRTIRKRCCFIYNRTNCTLFTVINLSTFLEIDEGWWDLRAPALVLPGDNMPPLCTRNTLFSPEVFWALPLLPDYSRDDFEEHALESPKDDAKDGDAAHKSSRIPPWYIRGLWSQSLLGDLGGSIRLTLSRVPTLQILYHKNDGNSML